MVSGFCINTQDGRVATQWQLADAELLDDDSKPVKPWHPIPGPQRGLDDVVRGDA